jgi:hypothetical protein
MEEMPDMLITSQWLPADRVALDGSRRLSTSQLSSAAWALASMKLLNLCGKMVTSLEPRDHFSINPDASRPVIGRPAADQDCNQRFNRCIEQIE